MMGIAYKMKIPNLEVRIALNRLFYLYLTHNDNKHLHRSSQIETAFTTGQLSLIEETLKSLFASIPYEHYTRMRLLDTKVIMLRWCLLFFSSLGYQVIMEDSTNTSRIDMTLIGKERIAIVEFKVDKPAEDALKQILDRRYFEKYQDSTQGRSFF